jgi:hypothetical protein
MTKEKIVKLNEAGFVFSATRRPAQSESGEENEDLPDTETVATTTQQE